ncbi:MAG TPA: CRISPR-associated protein Cas4 [Clostridia bacterium]|nr:CRISPR-associated protein Cas4 [Clostridia bacterium]
MYPDDYLPISAIQHYAFCPRQFALIYIENQWNESYLTASGRLMHKRVHDENIWENKGDILVTRGLRLSSDTLKVFGVADVVEYHPSNRGVVLPDRNGRYIPYPVEYKHGKSKVNDCDRLQLCVQCICLEEMHDVDIIEGAIFYGRPRRREVVEINNELRKKAIENCRLAMKMLKDGLTPQPHNSTSCKSCSMKDVCRPDIFSQKADEYWKKILNSI